VSKSCQGFQLFSRGRSLVRTSVGLCMELNKIDNTWISYQNRTIPSIHLSLHKVTFHLCQMSILELQSLLWPRSSRCHSTLCLFESLMLCLFDVVASLIMEIVNGSNLHHKMLFIYGTILLNFYFIYYYYYFFMNEKKGLNLFLPHVVLFYFFIFYPLCFIFIIIIIFFYHRWYFGYEKRRK
jgi:hypothetical protein